MTTPPLRKGPRLFVDAPLGEGVTVRIEGGQAHYLLRVMRQGVGDTAILCDDRTGEWIARVAEAGKREVALVCEARLRMREATPDLWLCAALLKKDRFDWVLEKATELGVGTLRPVLTRRCVADRINSERARAVMIEAAEQCERTALPALTEPVPLARLLAEWPEGCHLFFADETGGAPAAATFAAHSGPAALLIGPEGGFDPAEREAIRAHPAAHAISLGPRVLRGETASVAATALWMAQAGDWHE